MTALDIFNRALAAIGHPRFLSAQASPFPEGVVCRREYDGARQSVLAAHEWGWLASEIPLCDGTEDTNSDTGRTLYIYPRPPAALRITAVQDANGRAVRWNAVNGGIQAPAEVASVRYLPDSVNPDNWPGSVLDAVVVELAARIAIPLDAGPNAMKNMRALAAAALAKAIGNDGGEVRYGGSNPNKYADARR